MDAVVCLLVAIFAVSMVLVLLLRRGRAFLFPGADVNGVLRFAAPFVAGSCVILLEAVVVLAQMSEAARPYVLAIRTLSLTNGLTWGLLNLTRGGGRWRRASFVASWALVAGFICIPVIYPLQVLLFVFAAIFAPVLPVWIITLSVLYALLRRGSLSGVLGKFFGGRSAQEIDAILSDHSRSCLVTFLVLVALPPLVFVAFLTATHLEWMTGIGPLH